MVDAKKERIGEKAALEIARSMQRVIAARGTKIVTFDLKKAPPTDADLLAVIMGNSGNLRAPTLKVGTTLLVGFNEEAYDGVLR